MYAIKNPYFTSYTRHTKHNSKSDDNDWSHDQKAAPIIQQLIQEPAFLCQNVELRKVKIFDANIQLYRDLHQLKMPQDRTQDLHNFLVKTIIIH